MGEALLVEIDLEIEDIPDKLLDDIIKKIRLYELNHIFNESGKFSTGISFFDEKEIKLTVLHRYIDRLKKQLSEDIKNDDLKSLRSNLKL